MASILRDMGALARATATFAEIVPWDTDTVMLEVTPEAICVAATGRATNRMLRAAASLTSGTGVPDTDRANAHSFSPTQVVMTTQFIKKQTTDERRCCQGGST